MKKYSVIYTNGATGYGWEKEYDKIDEFEEFVNKKEKDYMASIKIWDNEIEEFIYWKVNSHVRDLRKTIREKK